MREIFARAWLIMKRRKSVIWQFLAIVPAVIIAAILGGVLGAVTGSAVLGILFGIVLLVFLMLFVLGAVYGALGEATAGVSPSPYFLRGWRLIGKSAAFLGTAIVAGLALFLVTGAVTGALFGTTLAQTANLQRVSAVAPSLALPLMEGLLLRVGAVMLVVSLSIFPLINSVAAGLFVGRTRFSTAIYSAGQEYLHGRFPQWLAIWAVNVAGTVIYEGLYFVGLSSVPTQPGLFVLLEFVSLAFGLGLSWYTTALAFALWLSHQPTPAPSLPPEVEPAS